MKDSEIINAYKKYQASRTEDSEDETLRIVAMARQKISASTVDKTESGDEEHVTTLFNTYQQQRDPHREKITATVMAAARQNIQQRQNSGSANIFQSGKAFFSTPQRILTALRNRFTEEKPTFHWQMAAPALVLVAVVAILVPQMTSQDELGLSYADNGISAGLLKQAPQLVATIQHSAPMAGFGFSDAIDLPSAAFQLGTMTTDLYIANAANDSKATSATIINIQRIVTQSGISDTQLSSLENLSKATDKTHPDQTLALAHDLEHYFSGHTQEAMFRFGKWLEASLLATQSENSQSLKDLMVQWQQDGRNSELNISSPISKLIADLDDITTAEKLTFDEIRKLRQQLLQIKAALQ